MPVLSIFCRFASRVTGGSSASVSVSLSAVSSRTCVGRRSCCDRGSASRFRLSPRLWSTVRRVVVRNRVILGCDVTRCLCRLAPGASSVLVRFFRGPRCHCLVIAFQCLVACLSSRMCCCCCLSLSSAFGVSVPPLAVAGLFPCVGRANPSVLVRGLRCARSFLIFHMSCRPVLMVSLMFFAALVAMSYARAALLLGCCRCIMSVSIGLQYVVNQPSHILVAPGSVSLVMYRISLSSLTSLQSYTSCSCVADCPATPLSDLCVHICWISSSSLSLTWRPIVSPIAL